MRHSERVKAMQEALGLYHYLAEDVVRHLEQQGAAIYRKRKLHAPRRPVNSQPATPRMAGLIRKHAKANPHLTQAQIAAHFNVNPGRVSEALSNDR